MGREEGGRGEKRSWNGRGNAQHTRGVSVVRSKGFGRDKYAQQEEREKEVSGVEGRKKKGQNY